MSFFANILGKLKGDGQGGFLKKAIPGAIAGFTLIKGTGLLNKKKKAAPRKKLLPARKPVAVIKKPVPVAVIKRTPAALPAPVYIAPPSPPSKSTYTIFGKEYDKGAVVLVGVLSTFGLIAGGSMLAHRRASA